MGISYNTPPIIQRIFTIYFELSEESFYSNLPLFEREIKQQLPEKSARKNWALNFKSKNGKPDFSSVKPIVEIIREFNKNDASSKKFFSIELEENRISFNLRRTNDLAHTFKDLQREVKQALPVFLHTLNPEKVVQLDLDYVNLVSRANTPKFVDNNGGIHVDKLLKIFNRFPSNYESIAPPYDCQIGLVLDRENGYNSIVRVFGLQEGVAGASAVRVDLNAHHKSEFIEIDESNFEKQLNMLHDYVLNLFHDTFTEEAKKAF